MKNMKDLLIKEDYVIKLTELQEDFLKYIDVSDKTIETYKIALRQFANYLYENDIKVPTREDIINYRESLKADHKPTTINGYMIALRNFYKYLEYQGITKNITENVKSIKLETHHLKRSLSVEEVQKVLENCKNDKERLMVKMMISCALRCNELVNVKLEDFYNDGGVIMLKVLGKGRDGYKQDSVKIDNRLFEEIKSFINSNDIKDFLFVSNSNNNNGGQLTTKTIRKTIKRIFEDSGLDNIDLLSAHSLRHTSATLSLKNGLAIEEVSENLRHKSLSTTMIYLDELNKKESLFADKLCDMLY